MTTDNPLARTKYDAQFAIDYAAELNARCRNFYSLLRLIFGFAFIASGSTALAALQLGAGFQVSLSVVITVMGILSVMIDPGAKSVRHEALRQKWVELKKDAQKLELSEIEEKIQSLYGADIQTIRALHDPSWNAVALRVSQDNELIPLTRLQRFMGAIT